MTSQLTDEERALLHKIGLDKAREWTTAEEKRVADEQRARADVFATAIVDNAISLLRLRGGEIHLDQNILRYQGASELAAVHCRITYVSSADALRRIYTLNLKR